MAKKLERRASAAERSAVINTGVAPVAQPDSLEEVKAEGIEVCCRLTCYIAKN